VSNETKFDIVGRHVDHLTDKGETWELSLLSPTTASEGANHIFVNVYDNGVSTAVHREQFTRVGTGEYPLPLPLLATQVFSSPSMSSRI
jgi:hypothetical protein